MYKRKVGDKLRIKDNTGFHGFNIGETIKIKELVEDEKEYFYYAEGENDNFWYVADEELEEI